MKKYFLIIMSFVTTLQCCGQVSNKDFIQFTNKFTELKFNSFPVNCKPEPSNFFYFTNNPFNKISLMEAKQYLEYSDKEYYITTYDYDMDEDKIYNIKSTENPPFANNKILKHNYILLIHFKSSSLYLNECDTAVQVLSTFKLDGELIDKLVIQGHYTVEEDWRDVVFLSNDTLRIFDYKPNIYNNDFKSIVEINDYKIDNNGTLVFIQTYPQMWLKNWANNYSTYKPQSDDPMNEYE